MINLESEKRKPWREMTVQEVNELSRKQCNTCIYCSKENASSHIAKPCDYITIEGHMRGCDPRDCKKFGIYKFAKEKKRRAAWRSKVKN